VAAEIASGHVRPSLIYQIDNRIEDAALLPAVARKLDARYIPPHRQGTGTVASIAARPLHFARAALRHAYQKTFLHDLERRIRRRVNT
jgi:hypothetical protein